MVPCARENSSCTACAIRCEVEWRRMSSPSGLFGVTIARSASDSMRCERSTSLPSTFAASAARARPAPIDCATSAAVTGPGNDFCEPSGRRMLGIRHERLYPITMKLPLTLAINPYDHARDLRAEGIDLTVLELDRKSKRLNSSH